MKALTGLILLAGTALVVTSMVWPRFNPGQYVTEAEQQSYERAIFALHSTAAVSEQEKQMARDVASGMVEKLETAKGDHESKRRIVWGVGLAVTGIGIALFILKRGRPGGEQLMEDSPPE